MVFVNPIAYNLSRVDWLGGHSFVGGDSWNPIVWRIQGSLARTCPGAPEQDPLVARRPGAPGWLRERVFKVA